MGKRRVWAGLIVASCLAGILVAPSPAEAATGGGVPTARWDAGGRRADRAARRASVIDSARARPSVAVQDAPAKAAGLGDFLVVPDVAGDAAAGPKGDVRSLQVGLGGDGKLQLTMVVEQYVDPLTDPGWVDGFTGGFWFLDTSGDAVPEVVVDLYNDGDGLTAEIFDFHSEVYVCAAGGASSAATKSYTAVVTDPACLGDVKTPAVGAAFVYNAQTGAAPDFAPESVLARFTRPATERFGGYAIVTRGAGFQRYGSMPRPQCPGCPPLPVPITTTPGGTFEDYVGPRPVVATASARPYDPGLWSVTDDGEVSTQDGAEFFDDATPFDLVQPIVGMAVLPDRSGYWLVASDGGIFAFGDAAFYGSTGGIRLDQPIVGMAATPSGLGYWLVASDGGIFAYGDAAFYGSTGGIPLNKPVVGMAPGYQGQGYWLVASDGGIFSYGLPFYGSTGAIRLEQPIVAMAATRSGGGYRFIARDGGIFSYGDAEFWGSGAAPGRTDVIGIATA